LESATLYAHGRLLQQRHDFTGALRQYQRSFRLNPQARVILSDIVPLAVQLNRPLVAARYALVASRENTIHPDVLQQLAVYMTDLEQYSSASQLYELILPQIEQEPNPSLVLIHFELGRLYFLAGEYEKSASSYEIVRLALAEPERFDLEPSLRDQLLGDAAVTYSVMGESFLKAGRPLGAASMFQKADGAKRNPPLLAFHMARVAEAQGDTREALRQLDIYLESNLSTAGTHPYELLGRLLQPGAGASKTADALRNRLEALWRRDAKNPALGYFLAAHYREIGQTKLARELHAELIKTTPTLEGYRSLVQLYQRERMVDPLLDILGEVVSRLGSLEPLGPAAQAVREDRALIADLISRARVRMTDTEHARTADAAFAVALIALGDRQLDVAEALFEHALGDEQSRQIDMLLRWGLELLTAEQYAKSATAFKRGLEQKGQAEATALLQFYLAGALALEGKTDEALQVAETLAEAEDAAPLFHSRRCWILYHAGRKQEAETHYRQLIDRFDGAHDPPEIREVLRDARSALANLCVEEGRPGDAEEWLEQILDEYPNDAGAMNDLGYLWADQNKHLARALQWVAKAVEHEPDNPAFRDSLGWTLFRLGRYEQSIEELQKAAVGEDPDGTILDHLGDAYTKLGNTSAALASWQKALDQLQRDNDASRISAIQAKIEQHKSE
jgi:tetratricopeptide (TPR) repeat protein